MRNHGCLFTEIDTAGIVGIAFPDESGSIVGSWYIVGIPQHNIIVNYDINGYSYQVALPDKQQTLKDASVEAVDGDIVLNFKKLLLEKGDNDIFPMVPRTSSMNFLTMLVRDVYQTE